MGMMNTSNIIALAIGAAVGSLVTWRLLKNKYEQQAQNEIAEMREFYSNKTKKFEPKQFEQKYFELDTFTPEAEASNIIKENAYGYPEEEKGGEKAVYNDDKPYVITPEEFGEKDDYETVSLTYYADGVLADDADEPIDDIDDVVGKESLEHFGEYEDDSVFVRNDIYRCDYEILLDTRRYEDIRQGD